MNFIGKHFEPQQAPVANAGAIVAAGNARFTVLTDRIIRMEYSPAGQFEDRASRTFWHRNQPVPSFEVRQGEEEITICTEYLTLTYRMGELFSRDSLSVLLKAQDVNWRFGDKDGRNLKGTTRTLDKSDGEIELEDGLMSRSGWAVVDDSKTPIFGSTCLFEGRESDGGHDLYFFGYATDYKACLRDYCRISGRIPMIPRFMLGNWWSRYWKYSDKDLMGLMTEFKDREIPLSVCIIDMDWHIVENEYHNGWTGYTWNRECFPKPEEFINWLHENGLRTALNLHPADGIAPHEAQYGEMARAMGIDSERKEIIEFDIADPGFIKAYFEILHHPYEKIGIDFWWMDWQQGNRTKIEGLDPLWILNHLHFYDLSRDGKKRGVIFSRWGGLGNHRYPIGFSGDTVVSWDSLGFQPKFTATASNVGYCWWSHDIGGHYKGREDDELYARWVQYGVFSPIMRLHSCNDPIAERRPWVKGEESYRAAKAAMQLRHRLVPYIYSMAYKMSRESEAFIRPMYYDNPSDENAYKFPNQYWFGSEIIAAPVTSPVDKLTGRASQEVWLPEGDWYSFFTGEHFEGNRIHTIESSLQEIPVFARAGAIVPMTSRAEMGSIENPRVIDLYIFPGADNTFELYEDDGKSTDFEGGKYCITKINLKSGRLNVNEAQGDLSVIPSGRRYNAIFK